VPALKATSVATVQLGVPVTSALGAIAFLGESMTLRLVLASAAILAGIALVILKEDKGQRPADVLRRRGNAVGLS